MLYRLKDAGYQAFLVGGGVRDVLLGIVPKDFDVATNALPEEIRRVFRNCRLIGRRFRLAHVHFGNEIIEVATFRASAVVDDGDDETDERGDESDLDPREFSDARVHDTSGRILRDNLYGGIDADVWRRDFTANALYYNIADFSVWDYVGGVADVQARVLRLIGDPEVRYREDPVRMLRAARFAAKLDFTLHPATRQPLRELGVLLEGVPAARLFDECLKLFLAGHAVAGFERLKEFHLLEHLLPGVARELAIDPEGEGAKVLALGLAGTDARVRSDRSVTPMFLFAVFLYGPIMRLTHARIAEGVPPAHALADACDAIIGSQVRRVGVPKRFTLPLRELLTLQPRFERRDGRRALALLSHPRFRAAYDFMLLRAQAGGVSQEIATWWTEIQTLTPEEQIERVQALGASESDSAAPKRRRRPRGRPKPNNPPAS